MPRLAKLLEESRFKSILKSFDKDQGDDKKIMSQYQILYYYNMFKLMLIAIIATYFLGCFWYVISRQQRSMLGNFFSDTEITWYEEFALQDMTW